MKKLRIEELRESELQAITGGAESGSQMEGSFGL